MGIWAFHVGNTVCALEGSQIRCAHGAYAGVVL